MRPANCSQFVGSIFGSGLVLNGTHEGIQCEPVVFDQKVQIIRNGCYTSNKIGYVQNISFSTVEEFTHLKSEKEFLAGEGLGCEPPRRCLKCKGCQDCRFRGAHMSPKEAIEFEMMESGMSFDDEIRKWRVQYPFLQNPSVLQNDYSRVLKMQERTERKLRKQVW